MDIKKYLFVLDKLNEVPEGYVVTYGQVAKVCSLNTPRLVGRILHNNPDSSKYPCHRVVFSDGKLSDAFAFGGAQMQRGILESEGVSFSGDKVDLVSSQFHFT